MFFITLFITFLFCDQCFQLKETQNCIFGSLELKAKVRFSHHILSGVRLSVYLPISQKVCTEHPSVRGFKFINMKRMPSFKKKSLSIIKTVFVSLRYTSILIKTKFDRKVVSILRWSTFKVVKIMTSGGRVVPQWGV